MPHLFSELYKPLKKQFEESFASDKVKFKSTTKTNDDLEVEVNGEKTDKGSKAELQWKQTFTKEDKKKYVVTGKLDGKGSAFASLEADNLKEGLNLLGSGKLYSETPKVEADKDPEGDHIAGEVKYKHENFTGTFAGKVMVGQPLEFTASAVALYKGFALGAQGRAKVPYGKDNKESPKIDKYDFGFRFDGEKIIIASSVEDSLKLVKVGVSHTVRDDLTVGAEFSHKLKEDKKKKDDAPADAPTDAPADDKKKKDEKPKPSLAVFVNKNIDKESSVAAKIGLLDGVADVAYKLKLNKDLTSTFSVQTKLFKFGNDAKVGVSFEYAPKKE